MDNRLLLQKELEKIINNSNVYYQPPESFKIKYPCVLYNQEVGHSIKANNKIYTYTKKYSITFMYNSDNVYIINTMLNTFEHCSLSTLFVRDNLYHYIFTLYY